MFVEEDKAGSVVFYSSLSTSRELAKLSKMAGTPLVSDAVKAATLTPCRLVVLGEAADWCKYSTERGG